MRLFLYGSLMRGEPAHGLVAGARFLGPARTAPGHGLVLCEDFPGLVASADPAEVVVGELYWLDDPQALAALDAYEDAPALYRRAPVALAEGEPAVAYWLGEAARRRARPLPGGDWRRRSAAR